MSGAFGRLLAAVLLITVALPTTASQVTYYHTDALGSVVMESNEAGQVAYQREYRPYGDQASTLDPSKEGPGYTGHVQDAATGLTYMQQRYYDPGIGRFLSVDPVAPYDGSANQFNRYIYSNNNPYKFVDPDGKEGVLSSFMDQIKREVTSYVLKKTYQFGTHFVAEAKKDVIKHVQSHTYALQVGLGGTIMTPIRDKVPMGGSIGFTGGANFSLNNHGQVQLSMSGAPLVGQGGGATFGASWGFSERSGGADASGSWVFSQNHHAELAFSVPKYPFSFGGAIDWTDEGVGLAKGSERFGVGRGLYWGAGEQFNYAYTFNDSWWQGEE